MKNLMGGEGGMTRDLSKKLTVELVLKRRMLHARVDKVLDGAEVVLKGHWLHGSGEVELKMLEEVLCLGIEGAGRKRGESLMEST